MFYKQAEGIKHLSKGIEQEHVTYLEKKNELREALDGLHHQAVERDAVHAGHLLPLSTERDIKRFDSRKCTGISFVCLFVRLFFFFSAEKYPPEERRAVCRSESKHVRIPG